MAPFKRILRVAAWIALILVGTNFARSQSNDRFAGRVALTGTGGSAISDSRLATPETGEPNPAGIVAGNPLWWTWTAPATGIANFSNFGSADTAQTAFANPVSALSVYTGNSLTTISESGSSNNNQNTASLSQLGVINTGLSFNVPVTAGQVYQILLNDPGSPVVLNVNQPPTLVSTIAAVGAAGTSFSYSVQASNSPLTYGATGLPSGLSINPYSGLISGTPAASGTFAVNISATNCAGTGSAVLTLVIGPAASGTSVLPAIYSAAAVSTVVGNSYVYNIAATGSPFSYGASGLPPGLGINVTTGEISGSLTTAGVYPISITAANSVGTTTAILTLTVAGAPQLPIITTTAVPQGTVGTAFTYYIESSDYTAAGTPFRYSATNLPAGLGVDTSSGAIQGTPTTAGVFSVPVSATNSAGTGTAILTITIASPSTANSSLVITSGAVVSGTYGVSFAYAIAAQGNPTSFSATSLPPGLSLDAQSGYITGTPTSVGTYTVPISATNASGSVSATLTIIIGATATNSANLEEFGPVAPPVITSPSGASAIAGQSFTYVIVAATSSEGDIEGYSSVTYGATGLPAGLTINSTTGLITGTPAASGTYSIALSATETGNYEYGANPSPLTGTATLTLTVAAGPVAPNAAPIITNGLATSGAVGSAFTYAISATGNPTNFGATGLPAGLSVNTSTGAISGTPTSAGTFVMTLSATNAISTGSAQITCVIANSIPAPVITNSCAANGTAGSFFGFYLSATNSPTTFSTGTLPTGLTLTASTGYISGTPTTAGTYVVPIAAANSGGTGSATLTFTIAALRAPTINSSASATGVVGTSFTYYIYTLSTATSYGASNLPAGLSLNSSSGEISGTPSAVGTYTVPISATNAAGTGTASITLLITNSPGIPVINSAAEATATVGTSFYFYISAYNSATSYGAGSLPPGLSISTSSGAISGTPTASGTFTVPITATNAGGSGQATLTIVISPAATTALAPIVTSAAAGNGYIGIPLSYTIAGTNSPTSFAASNLPSGLTINTSTGIISGTVHTAGVYSIPISATNSGGTANATLTLAIATAPTEPPVITSASWVSGTYYGTFSYTITATNGPTSFTAVTLPLGLHLNSSTGLISGTLEQYGPTNVTISASNAAGQTSATLTIAAGYPQLSVTSAAGALGYVGFPFTYTFATYPYSYGYGALSPLPSGLALNTTTGQITGTPTTSGTFPIQISCYSTYGTVNAAVTLIVESAAGSPPVLSSSAEALGYVGAPFTYTITGSEMPTSYGATSLPNGLSLNATTGVISGIPQASGTFTLPISATNSVGTANAALTLNILSTPPTPVISSTAESQITVGSTGILYTISATNTPTQFGATGLPPGLSLDTASGEISGQATTVGIYPATLSAANAGGTATVSVKFLVVAATGVPVINSDAGGIATVGATYYYDISASNSPVSYAVGGLPPGLYLNPGNGQIFGTPSTAGQYTVSLSAANSAGTGTAVLTLTVLAAPVPPTIDSGAATAAGQVGSPFTYYFYAYDDANSTSFNVLYSASGLPPGLALDVNGGSVTGTPTAAGVYSVTLSATASGVTTSAVVVMTIAANNAPPAINGPAGAVGFTGSSFAYAASTNSLPGATYGATNLPAGLQINAGTGVITGTPTTAGNYTATIFATNPSGSSSANVQFGIYAAQSAPVFSSAAAVGFPGFNYYPGVSNVPAFSYTLTASNGPASFSATNLPAGLSLNPATGVISGTINATGTFAVPISATNTVGTSNAVLTIIANSLAPTLALSAEVAGNVGSPLIYNIPAIGPFLFPYLGTYFPAVTYSAVGLPPGLTLNTATGAVSGTPSLAGSFSVLIAAINGGGTSQATTTFVIGTAAASQSPPVFLTTSAAVSAAVGTFVKYTAWASNLPTNFTATNLPPGLSLSISPGNLNGISTSFATISGTPTASGTFAVPISAINSLGTASMTATFIVSAQPPTPVIASSAFTTGWVGTPFSYFAYTNYNATTANATKTYSAANLPPGLAINVATGLISGTPTVGGTYTPSISATVGGQTGTATLTMVISAVPVPGTVPSLSGSAGALGFVGLPFSYLSTAVGASTLTASKIPGGLSLSISVGTAQGLPVEYGSITGVPTTAGIYAVPITATNGAGSANAVLTITIVSPQSALPIITSQPGNQTINPGGNATFTVAATGIPSPTFQWACNGNVLSGATNPTLTISGATAVNAGTYSVTVTNAAGNVLSNNASLVVTQTFGSWQTAYFSLSQIAGGLASPTAEFNQDGVPNLLAYALDRNPVTGQGGSLPVVSLPNGSNYLQIAFQRDPANTDISYIVEASDDLLNWTPIARSVAGGNTQSLGGASTVSETGTGAQSVVVQDGTAISSTSHRFLHLKITSP